MTPRTFETELWIPTPPPAVFGFFADARNLETITPGWLHFEILTRAPIEMRQGTLIDYRLRVHGLPIRWQTEITDWTPPHRFSDTQRRGPYRLWTHEHTFEEKDGGTLARDRVRYAVPGGVLIDRLFVRKDVEAIFAFRRRKLSELFGADPAGKGGGCG